MFKSSRMRYGIATLGLVAGILSVGQVAEAASVDRLSVWVAPGYGGYNPDNLALGVHSYNPANLADWFKSVWLRVDLNGDEHLTKDETVSAGLFDKDADSISNPNITYSKTGKTFTTASNYKADIWRVDFNNLGLDLASQRTYNFGVKGFGRSMWKVGPSLSLVFGGSECGAGWLRA